MNNFVHLPLKESMIQCGAGKHDQWRGYLTVHVVNHGITNFIRILTTVIRLMIKCDVDNARDSFCQNVKWRLAIC